MSRIDRRQWFQQSARAGVAAAAAFSSLGNLAGAEPDTAAAGCTLSIGTYAMKGVPLERALASIAQLGFDGVELAVMPGYSADPQTLSAQQRKAVRSQLVDTRLRLTALMEHVFPEADNSRHQEALARLRRAFELGRQLGDKQRLPLVQTALGGGNWEDQKNLFRDRLGDWLTVAKEQGMVLAVKPHRGGAMSRPGEAIWLIEQLGGSTHLRMVYDYSHYAFRNMPLEETVRTALPYMAHVAVKDAVQMGEKVTFLLPGEQNTHFPQLFKLLYQGGYRGDICCEVSSQVSSKANYDPLEAAKICYRNMASALQAAEVPRPRA